MPDNVMSLASAATCATINPLAAKPDTTVAYTDGACKGNPGAGGWGAHLIFSDGQTQDLYGGAPDTTNNRMELMGAIQALTHSPHEPTLEIWTDSSYVQKGITEWVANWKKRGWKTASNKPVANQDLWQQLDALCQTRKVEWHWVKGHAGHAGNEKADELANLGVTSSSKTKGKDAFPKSTVLTTSEVKKKEPLMTNNTSQADHSDWLLDDPLGLNVMDEGSDQSFSTQALDTNTAHQSDVSAPHSINASYASNSSHRTSVLGGSTSDSTALEIQDSVEKSLPKFDGDTSRANPHFRPLLPQPINRHAANRQLIMDTETTGLDPLKGDRVIEVGIVEMIGRKFTGEKLHVYINPQRGMDEVVIRIHGISEAFLTDKPTFDQVAQSLYDFMDGAEIIAHNASFDMNFLSMEFERVGITDFAERVQVTDSLVMAKQQYPGQKNTLDALVRRLEVGKQDRTFHGALLDSEILAEVYLAMTGGQVTLAIEDDIQTTEGGQSSNSHFANLAALLVESIADDSGNKDWFTSLSSSYPEIKNVISQ
ncbi:DNA polymerase III subunit epsilon [Psychrobacter sp. GP33]|uniref:DNA polymerase III subunit epsilon n=1 Tax=Psychrobacter sp. GP33 TaxID=2758709 RepID=UPI0015FE3789|nr:DNA polymerase III subunit epsilon [Psychrobacter sp. GP33]